MNMLANWIMNPESKVRNKQTIFGRPADELRMNHTETLIPRSPADQTIRGWSCRDDPMVARIPDPTNGSKPFGRLGLPGLNPKNKPILGSASFRTNARIGSNDGRFDLPFRFSKRHVMLDGKNPCILRK